MIRTVSLVKPLPQAPCLSLHRFRCDHVGIGVNVLAVRSVPAAAIIAAATVSEPTASASANISDSSQGRWNSTFTASTNLVSVRPICLCALPVIVPPSCRAAALISSGPRRRPSGWQALRRKADPADDRFCLYVEHVPLTDGGWQTWDVRIKCGARRAHERQQREDTAPAGRGMTRRYA